MLELTLALALGSMLLIWGAGHLLRQIDDAAEQASGVWLLEIKKALDQMLIAEFDPITRKAAPSAAADFSGLGDPVADRAVGGYADILAPTVAELAANGYLPSGFHDRSPLGFNVRTRIFSRKGCGARHCGLDAIAYTATPVLLGGSPVPDFARIAGIVMATGGYGGAVRAGAPERLRGANFNFPNPPASGLAALPVGTLAVWSGLSMAAYERYVRRRDDRDPELQGQLSVAGGIHAGGRLATDEYLYVAGSARAGQRCKPDGLIGRDEAGAILACTGSVWKGAGRFGGAYAINTANGCSSVNSGRGGQINTRNPITGNCSCPAAYAKVMISISRSYLRDDGEMRGYICVG